VSLLDNLHVRATYQSSTGGSEAAIAAF